ncbi:MAG: hypothetical protein IKN38_06380, partial [Clostridia bacterium]|nr:hypothetical protein [Clostridia bacterium]
VAGDTVFISSVCLCSSGAEASAVAYERESRANGIVAGGAAFVQYDSEDASSLITQPYIADKCGDVNCDGALNLRDISELKNYLANAEQYTQNTIHFDVNRDGVKSIMDLSVLKGMIAGIIDVPQTDMLYPKCTVGFDDEDGAATVTRGAGEYATFKVELDFDEPAYAVFVYKISEASDITVYYGDNITTAESETASFTSADGYGKLILTLPEQYGGDSVTLCTDGVTIYVDSFGLFESFRGADAYANSRVEARAAGVATSDNFRIDFSESTVGKIEYSNNTLYSAESGNTLHLTVDTGRIDPYVYLDLSSYNLSANDYKYIIYNYKVPISGEGKGFEGQFFFCSDNASSPAEASSIKFRLTRNGSFVDQTFDLSTASYWGGKILGIRIDYFCDAYAGEELYLSSLTFCKTEDDMHSALGMN